MAGSFTWNNKVYVVGGYNPFFSAIGNVQIYDIAAGTWSNGAPMTAPVGDFASGLYNDSLFYVIAGYDGAGDVNRRIRARNDSNGHRKGKSPVDLSTEEK